VKCKWKKNLWEIRILEKAFGGKELEDGGK